jgi:hypothetical protein
MQWIRQAVTCLCLASTLSVAVPSLAVSGEVCRGDESTNLSVIHPESKLNLAPLRTMSGWSAEAMASSQSPAFPTVNSQSADPQAVQTQTGGKKKWSTAKKTWVIVGSVVGAALIVAAVSNSGGGGGGGGY